jgi:hypothetical protein
MMRLAISAAASALYRSLVSRSGLSRDRILLIEVRSIDWQSLTFVGERHRFNMRLTGPEAKAGADRLCRGLDDAEFSLAGHLVADIGVAGGPDVQSDGSVLVEIEALTIED